MTTFLSPSFPNWSTLPAPLNNSDQEQLLTACYCRAQILAVLSEVKREATQSE